METTKKLGKKTDETIAKELGISLDEFRMKRKMERNRSALEARGNAHTVGNDNTATNDIELACKEMSENMRNWALRLNKTAGQSAILEVKCQELAELIIDEELDLDIVINALTKKYKRGLKDKKK